MKTVDDKAYDETNAIKCDTIEEYEQVLAQLNSMATSNAVTKKVNSNQTSFSKNGKSGIMMLAASSDPWSTVHTSTLSGTAGIPVAIPPIWCNMHFQYRTGHSKKYNSKKFTSIHNISVYLTGVQFPVAYTWKTVATNYRYTRDNTRATVSCTGNVGVHIIFNGTPKLVDMPYTYTSEWKFS